MEPASLALAIVGTIDLCLKYGNKFIEGCKTYRDAEHVLQERALRAEVCWRKIRDQIKFMRDHRTTFDDEIADLHSRMFDILESKLKSIDRGFNKLHGDRLKINKVQLVFKKEWLDKAISELESWQAIFDPSWAMMITMAKKSIARSGGTNDQHLLATASQKNEIAPMGNIDLGANRKGRSVWFLVDPLINAAKIRVPYSSIYLVHDTDAQKSCIVEVVDLELHPNKHSLTKDFTELAVRLESVSPFKYGMLQCKGAIRRKEDGRSKTLELMFRWPTNLSTKVTNLRDSIGAVPGHSLTERLSVALQLAKAICYVHALDFVHKNVRPESVLMFGDSEKKLGIPFLLGFQQLRALWGRTNHHQRATWDSNLYHHPDRQGEFPKKDHITQHDIYSLGVCLLEIGLWSPFVVYTAEDEEPLLGSIFEPTPLSFEEPETVKQTLIGIACEKLPCEMGDRYTEIVVNCLTCLDMENPYFSDSAEFEDENGILVGVRYMQKILLELEDISF